jgi:dGTPase
MKTELKKCHNCLQGQAFSQTRGRKKCNNEDFLDIIDPFEVDITKILNSKSFRRLKEKTQVFSFSKNNLIRNRLIHTLEVEEIAKTLALILGLNVSLVKAIALAHDIGHTSFGHLGEQYIKATIDANFNHSTFGVIVAQNIEKKGQGLNLCFETLEGIMHHSSKNGFKIDRSLPVEYGIVMLADKIAYLFSDIEDAGRLGKFQTSLPKELYLFGENRTEQVISCITAICKESYQTGYLSFENSNESEAFLILKKWMYDNLYHILDGENERNVFWKKINKVYHLLNENLFLYKNLKDCDVANILATMTDDEIYNLSLIDNLSIKDIKVIENMGFLEIAPYCQSLDYDKNNLFIDWPSFKS